MKGPVSEGGNQQLRVSDESLLSEQAERAEFPERITSTRIGSLANPIAIASSPLQYKTESNAGTPNFLSSPVATSSENDYSLLETIKGEERFDDKKGSNESPDSQVSEQAEGAEFPERITSPTIGSLANPIVIASSPLQYKTESNDTPNFLSSSMATNSENGSNGKTDQPPLQKPGQDDGRVVIFSGCIIDTVNTGPISLATDTYPSVKKTNERPKGSAMIQSAMARNAN
jgi:hypothetical protein